MVWHGRVILYRPSRLFIGKEIMGNYIRIRRWDEKEPNMDVDQRSSGSQHAFIETLYHEIGVLVGETTVQYVYIERIHGVSVNNKHFFKTRNLSKIIYSIRPNAYGEMAGKFYLKDGKNFFNISQTLSTNRLDIKGKPSTYTIGIDIFAAQVRKLAMAKAINVDETISIYDPAFTYPVLHHLHSDRVPAYPTAITRYAATNDLSKFVYRVFGKTRFRKDLVKAVANLFSGDVFMFGYWFRGLVPIDWIIGFYQKYAGKNPQSFNTTYSLSDMHKVLYKLPKKQVHKLFNLLITDYSDTHSHIIDGLLYTLESIYYSDLYSGIEGIKFTSLKEAHDKYSTYLRIEETKKRNAEFLKPLTKTSLAHKIDSIEYPANSDIKLKTADCAMDLVEWGGIMNHCIGSYAHEAINGNGTFGVILQNDKPIGNFHYSHAGDNLYQMFGKHNQELPVEVIVSVFKTLVENTYIGYDNIRKCSGARTAISDPRIQALKTKTAPTNNDFDESGTRLRIMDNPNMYQPVQAPF